MSGQVKRSQTWFGVALFAAVIVMLVLSGREAASADTLLPQTITFPTMSSPVSAGTMTTIQVTGGDSGQPVSVVEDGTSGIVCAVYPNATGPGWNVYFVSPGTCTIDANQSGDADYAAAATVSQSVTVLPISTSLTLQPATSVYGQSQTVTASFSIPDGLDPIVTPIGTVQFSENGTPVGRPVALENGTATSPDLTNGGTLASGTYSISAVFTPSDILYAPSPAATTTLTVAPAVSTTQLSIGIQSLSATVSSSVTGTPTGSVTFSVDGASVGTATLSGGTATLSYTVPSGATRNVSAVYSGDGGFASSTASVTRSDPTITATLSSASAESATGWYHAPVIVSFACAIAVAPLTAACPEPVMLAKSEASQSVTQTILATDGGSATATVSGINIDQTPPTVKVTGVKASGVYATAPAPKCLATDSLSGVASCKLSQTTKTSAKGLQLSTVRYTATATDNAGNVARKTGDYQLLGIYLNTATYRSGKFLVRAGHTYTLTVRTAKSSPRFVTTQSMPVMPAARFKSIGHGAWTLKVTLPAKLFVHRKSGELRIRIAGKLYTVPIKRG